MSETEKPKTPAKSWRDVLRVHEACKMFPPMSPGELAALGEDIQTRGLLSKITLFVPKESNKYFERGLKKEWAEKLDLFFLLDGANRLDALECRGVEIVDESGSLNPALTTGCVTFVFENWQHPDTKEHYAIDAYDHALALNLHRRHLSPEQKRNLIAALLKAQPEKSNRTIAQQIKADHKTVGAIRDRLEGRGEIPHVSTVEDTKGRQQPTKRARRTAAEQMLPDADRLVLEILERDKIAPGYALAVARGLAAHLGDGSPEMPGFLKRTAEPTAPATRG